MTVRERGFGSKLCLKVICIQLSNVLAVIPVFFISRIGNEMYSYKKTNLVLGEVSQTNAINMTSEEKNKVLYMYRCSTIR